MNLKIKYPKEFKCGEQIIFSVNKKNTVYNYTGKIAHKFPIGYYVRLNTMDDDGIFRLLRINKRNFVNHFLTENLGGLWPYVHTIEELELTLRLLEHYYEL